MFLINVPRSRPSRLSPQHLWDRGMAVTVSRQKYLLHGPARSGFAALTFQNGPHPELTPAILNVLAAHGVSATFFISGEKAAASPELLAEIADNGHVIGQCGYFEGASVTSTEEELLEELLMTEHWIRKFTGETPRLFRAAWEKLSLAKLRRLWLRGQTVVHWSLDPGDLQCQSAAELQLRFANQPIRSGDIIRLHDSASCTADGLSNIISGAQRCGVKFGTPLQWLAG